MSKELIIAIGFDNKSQKLIHKMAEKKEASIVFFNKKTPFSKMKSPNHQLKLLINSVELNEEFLTNFIGDLVHYVDSTQMIKIVLLLTAVDFYLNEDDSELRERYPDMNIKKLIWPMTFSDWSKIIDDSQA